MKITKLGHSCLLVEMPERTALFDPGYWSKPHINVDSLVYLDDIIITHEHSDHMDIKTIKVLQEKFPKVRIKAASSAASKLNDEGLETLQEADEGIAVFDASHENIAPLGAVPDNMGVHYLGKLTHPGDSFNFHATMPILALPVTAPWGSTVAALKLAIELKPKWVIPIHDGQWNDEARAQMYDKIGTALKREGIEFVSPKNGEAFNLDV